MCIWIINYEAAQTVYQPIIQLFGFDSFYHETILINNKYRWPVVQGLFKIYIQLNPGENQIHMSTSTSELSFTLIYSPIKTTNINLRLIYISFSDSVDIDIEHMCKMFVFLTKFVRCTFDEILYKQTGYRHKLLFDIETKIHHIPMIRSHFEHRTTGDDIFKEIYRQISVMNLAQDASVKLIINSSISTTLTFAYTFNNMIVLNLPKQSHYIPISFDELYTSLQTANVEHLSYAIGAYLHELGHLFGLDHNDLEASTIMSSSKNYIDSGKSFFLVSSHVCSILYEQQCSCYEPPKLTLSCSYSNGLLRKHSTNFQSLCKSDRHCQFELKFKDRSYHGKSHQCACNGSFQFDVDDCQRLLSQLNNVTVGTTLKS